MAAAIALGVLQAGMSLYQMYKASKEKAPLEQVNDPADDRTAAKYESIFRKLSEEQSSKIQRLTNRSIQSNTANQIATTNKIFRDPSTRFRASVMASLQANEANIKSGITSDRTKLAYLEKAASMGINQRTYNRRVWSDMAVQKSREQGLYNERQAASGELLGAGIHNVMGSLDPSMQTPEGYKMSIEAYRQAKKAGGDDFPDYKEWKYKNFG
jgi:hypothetical protein